jgi:SAM-dependent methyltransferase
MVEDIREQVRARYARAALSVTVGAARGGDAPAADAGCCGGATATAGDACCGGATGATDTAGATDATAQGGCCAGDDIVVDETFGSALYGVEDAAAVPAEALAASLGCGNPLMVADLREGERVLDLGSGGGIDVLLSARRVGATGFAYGVDMTDEMLDLARANATKAGATNVEFRKGTIEDLPLDDAAVDVVISNCVVNLSPDKPAVLGEAFRVLVPGGRLGISDVVSEDRLTPQERGERGSYVGCIAGALSRTEYLDGLAAAGFVDASVEFTHPVADGLHGAIVRATKPAAVAG